MGAQTARRRKKLESDEDRGDTDWLIELFTEGDEDDELPEDLPAMVLINRRSVELFFLERAFPNIPLFDGPLIDWPDWYFADRRIIARADAACRAEKRAQQKSKEWANRERQKMIKGQ